MSLLDSQYLPSSVSLMQNMSLRGNVVPMQWFQTITFDNGKPDTNSILILSDIVYWYRPTEVRDEHSGSVIGHKKKFSEDLLRRSYADLESQFGISKKQCQESLRRLEERGVITRVFRVLDTPSGRLNNVMYIDLHPEVLREYTERNTQKTCASMDSGLPINPSTLYGDQMPQVWKSNSIGVETKLHTYGDQSPHHIKDTNTSSNNSSNITLSSKTVVSEGAAEKEREVGVKMLEIWNDMIPSHKQKNMSAYFLNLLEKAYHGPLEHSLKQWQRVCTNFKSSKFLMGEAEGVRIKPSLSWLIDPSKQHLFNVLNKTHFTFDDRVVNNGLIDPEMVRQEIVGSNESREAKEIRIGLLENFTRLYLGHIRHAKFTIDQLKLTIATKFKLCEERLNNEHFRTLNDYILGNYGKHLEVVYDKK